MPVAERAHLSIGEVLSLLQEEFPDITISKIRFLESQRLLDPERTPSGYRKFYDDDVERLRWILRQQREHFLPLKVIKGRLRDQPWLASVRPPTAPTLSVVPSAHPVSPARPPSTPAGSLHLHRDSTDFVEGDDDPLGEGYEDAWPAELGDAGVTTDVSLTRDEL